MSRQAFQNVGREPRRKILEDAQIVMKNSEFYIFWRIMILFGFFSCDSIQKDGEFHKF